MEYRQLKYILTIAECGSITGAANRLFISQPALSSFVTKTENSLGVQLFDRSVTPIALTYAGEKYVKTAARIVASYERMLKQLDDIKENKTGRMRIGIPEIRLAYMAPGLLTGMKNAHPLVEVSLVSGNADSLKKALAQGQIDFIVQPLQGPDLDFKCVELYRETVYAVARKGFIGPECLLEKRENTLAPRAIADLPILILPNSYVFKEVVERIFAANGITPSHLVECPSPASKLRLAAAGFGVDVVLPPSLAIIKTEEPMDVFFIGDPPAATGIYALFPKNAYLGRLEEECLAMIRELFAQKPAG